MRSIIMLAAGLVIGATAVSAIAWRSSVAKLICVATGINLTVPSRYRHPPAQCNVFLPTTRIRGIYRTGFEQGGLLDPDVPGSGWVEMDNAAFAEMEKLLKSKVEPNRNYLIEIEGQRTAERGGFGHLGSYAYVVLVSKVTAASPATTYP